MGSGSPREWVFVQKCLLERKRSYLTEKGLFSRKAPYGGPRISNPLPLCLRVCRLRRDDDPNISPWHTHNCDQVLVVTSGSGRVATDHEEHESLRHFTETTAGVSYRLPSWRGSSFGENGAGRKILLCCSVTNSRTLGRPALELPRRGAERVRSSKLS